tara:strand:+ start:3653 stop:4663 length:1011 start_codon:yes stop_codon:yes gene_type:complete
MAHPIHKHMHTHVTRENVKAAVRDDKAHMDYLKRDVKDDQRTGGEYKDINQTADEKHISKLAGDVKYDEKKEGISRKSSPFNEIAPVYRDPKNKRKMSKAEKTQGQINEMRASGSQGSGKWDRKVKKMDKTVGQLKEGGITQTYDTRDGKGGGSNRTQFEATFGDIKSWDQKSKPTGWDKEMGPEKIKTQRKDLDKYNPVDDRAGISRESSSPLNDMNHKGMSPKELHDHGMVEHPAKRPDFDKKKDWKKGKKGDKGNVYGGNKGVSRKVSEKRAKKMVEKGKGVMSYAYGGIGEGHSPGEEHNRGRFTKIKRKDRTGKKRTSYSSDELGKSMDVK